MTGRWQVSWKRVCIALCVIFFVAPVCMLLVRYQLNPWRMVCVLSSIEPAINTTPTALPDTSMTALHGNSIERLD